MAEDTDETPPMGLNVGDRVALEKKLERFDERLTLSIAERREQANAFYLTRMIPAEQRVARAAAVSWFSLGMVVVTLVFVLWLHR